MHPWIFYRHSRTPGGEDEFVDVAWEEIPSGFEMRVTRVLLTAKAGIKPHTMFSTEEQLNRSNSKSCKDSVLWEGFKPFMGDSPESES